MQKLFFSFAKFRELLIEFTNKLKPSYFANSPSYAGKKASILKLNLI